MSVLENLDVFCGKLHSEVAHVYARVAGVDTSSGLTLAGRVRGPASEYSTALPASIPLVDLGPGDSLLARAAVPDPCFWSPRLPMTYRVHVELRRDGAVIESAERWLGMRSFGPRGRSLFLESERWVIRGIDQASTVGTDLAEWRDIANVLIVENPSEQQLRDASLHGVLLIVRLEGDRRQIERQLRQLARWPAAAIALLESSFPGDEALQQVAPNILLAQSFPDSESTVDVPWTHLSFRDVGDPRVFADRANATGKPVVAVRGLERPLDLPTARAACDRLQRDLAPFGDFAGYCV